MINRVLDVYVYGGGDVVREIFNAVATTLNPENSATNGFDSLFRLSMLFAGTMAVYGFIFKKDFIICLKWFASFYLVFCIMLVPSVTVNIVDRTEGYIGKPRQVAHVPMALGIFAHITTSIGDTLTQLTEKTFSLPEDLKYGQTGMVMASRLALTSRQLQITDSRLNENMDRYMVQCVYWPIMLGHFTMDDLTSAPNLWEFIKDHAPQSRSFLYKKPNQAKTLDAEIIECNKGVSTLERELHEDFVHIAAGADKRFFSGRTGLQAKSVLLKYLPIAHGHLLSQSGEATKALEQSVVANAVTNGMLYLGTSTNSQTTVANYAATRAQEQQRLTQETIGFLAAHWLPIMKNVFEGIMYGCFIFIVLLTLFPFGIEVLKNYIYTLFWLQTWAPLYAIINLICTFYARGTCLGMGSTEGTFLLKNYYSFLQVNHDMANLAGYLTLSVPFIAAGLVKGMASTMTHVAQYMGGTSQSVGGQAASEAVAGNYSMGVTGMRNHSSFNTSSFQQDLRGRVGTGVGYQLPSGDMINIMSDGGVVVDRSGTLSKLGVDVNLAGSIQSTAMKQAEHAYSMAQSESIAASEHQAAAVRGLYELADHVGKGNTSADNWVDGVGSTDVKALNKIKDLTQTFADERGITYDHAKQIFSRINAGFGVSASTPGKASGGFGASGSLDISGQVQDTDTATEQRHYKAAETFMAKTGFSENFDIAARAVHDRSLTLHNEKGAKLLDSIGTNFEKAETLRKEASTNYQNAQSYRNMASYAEENGVRVNVDGSNAFFADLSNEQDPQRGGGRIGITGALHYMKDPEYVRIAAKSYAHKWMENHMAEFSKGNQVHLPQSGHEIKQAYQSSSKAQMEALNQNQLEEKFQGEKKHIAYLAEQKELKPEGSVDESIRTKVEDTIDMQKERIEKAKSQMQATEQTQAQKFKEEAADAKESRKHNVLHSALQTFGSKMSSDGHIKSPSDEIRGKMDEK